MKWFNQTTKENNIWELKVNANFLYRLYTFYPRMNDIQYLLFVIIILAYIIFLNDQQPGTVLYSQILQVSSNAALQRNHEQQENFGGKGTPNSTMDILLNYESLW